MIMSVGAKCELKKTLKSRRQVSNQKVKLIQKSNKYSDFYLHVLYSLLYSKMSDEQVLNSSIRPVNHDTTTLVTTSPQHKIDLKHDKHASEPSSVEQKGKVSKRNAKKQVNLEKNTIVNKNEKNQLYNKQGWAIADYGEIKTTRQQKLIDALNTISQEIPGFKVVTFHSSLCGGNFDFYNDRVLTLSKRRLLESFGVLFDVEDSASSDGTIIVRQILDEVDEKTGLAWSNIYSFRVVGDEAHRLPSHVTTGMCCRDLSGEMKTPEPSVNYC